MGKVAVIEDEVVKEITTKEIINEGIDRVIEELNVDAQKNRYKAMRAIAHQAFIEAIDSDDFDGLVDRAIAAADDLPAGWGLERTVAAPKEEKPKAKRPATKKAPAKPAAKAAPAKTAGRRRPARKSAE